MVHFCTMPGCSNRSDWETHLSYHRLPLKRKKILKEWIHNVGRANLLLNESTRVCSEHFVKSTGRMLRPDEVPSQKLPILRSGISSQLPCRHIVRYELPERRKKQQVQVLHRDTGVNTDLTGADLELLGRVTWTKGEGTTVRTGVCRAEREAVLSLKEHW